MTEYTTNANGIRFYIEPAMDFGADGRIKQARGVFAGLVVGSDEIGGIWFETRELALSAIYSYGAK